MSHVSRLLDPDRLDCVSCTNLHIEKSSEPPCLECMPLLLPENELALRVYEVVKTQYIMSFSGPVTLNILSVIEVVRLMGVRPDEQMKIVNQVMEIGMFYINKLNEKRAE